MASFGGGDSCTICSKRVYVTERVNIGDVKSGTKWVHKTCLKCSTCNVTLSNETYGSYEGVIYCKKHLREKFSSGSTNASTSAKPTSAQASTFNAKVEKDYCPACEKVVYLNEKIAVDDKLVKKTYHKTCFRCSHCNRILNLEDYVVLDGTLFCKTHFRELYHSKGKLDFAAESKLRSSSVSGRMSLTPSQSFSNLEKAASQETTQTNPEAQATSSKTVPEKSNSFVDTTPNPKIDANADGDKAMDSWSKKFNKFIKSDSESNLAPAKPSASSENIKIEETKAPAPQEPAKVEPNDKLIAEIHTGASLKHAETTDKSAPKLPAPGTTATDVRHVMEELEKNQGKNLKTVDHTRDASAPKIEADIQIKKTETRQELNQEIHKGAPLEHVETKDKAAPVIDPTAHIKTVDRTGFLTEVKEGVDLSHVEKSKDASAPKLPSATKPSDVRHVMEELEKNQGKNLKTVDHTRDASAPKIEADVQIKKTETRQELNQEIHKGASLEHVETKDKAAPVIDPNAHIKTVDRTGFLTEVKEGVDLSHVEKSKDASAPKLPSATKPSDVRHVMEELEKTGGKHLKSAETHDTSAPKIEADVHIAKSEIRKELTQEIKKGVTLEPTTTDDKSAPVIDASVHIEQNNHKELKAEITSGQTTLSHVASDEIHDASAPKLPSATKHETVQQAMKEITEHKPELSHPAVVSDRSAPVIEPNVHIKTLDKESHLKEIEKGVELSHAETTDKSVPVIDANVHIKASHKKDLNKEIEAKVEVETTEEAKDDKESATEQPEKEEEDEKEDEKKSTDNKKKKKSKKSKKGRR